MKLAIVVVGALIVIVSVIQGGFSVGNRYAAAGLLLFCLSASTYFITWPVSRDEEQNWRFNSDFVWFSIYLVVAVVGASWLGFLLF
jgi:hypothetical protein